MYLFLVPFDSDPNLTHIFLPSPREIKMVFQESQTILRSQDWLKSLTFGEIYSYEFFNFRKDFLVVSQTV